MTNAYNKFNKKAKEMEAKALYEAIMSKEANDMEVLDKVKRGSIKIDLSEDSKDGNLRRIQVLARLGYNAGSEIGLIIVALSIADTLKDMELNKQFLIPGTNKVCSRKIKKVFKTFGKGNLVGYNRIFDDKQYNVVTDKSGRKHVILLALKEQIKEFVNTISQTKELYQEDLVKIGEDLGIIATVTSEIEIDSAKKPWLKDDLPSVSSYMNEKMNLRSRNLSLSNNFDEFKTYKNKKKDAKRPIFSNELSDKDVPLLENFEEELKIRIERFNALNPTCSGEFKKKGYAKVERDLLKECVIIDPLSEFAISMLNQQNKVIGEIIDIYADQAHMKLFEQFNIDFSKTAKDAAEAKKILLAMNRVRRVSVTIYEMINFVYKYKKSLSLDKVEDIAQMGRNIIYSTGEKYGLTPSQTFFVGVDAGWYSSVNKKLVYNNTYNFKRYKFKAVEAVFGTELKYYFNAEAMYQDINVELPDELFELEIDFEELFSKPLSFEDGCALLTVVDDEEYYAFRVDNNDFTGEAIASIDDEGYLSFREAINPFEFKTVEFLLFDSLADTTIEESKIDTDKIEALKKMELTEEGKGAFDTMYHGCKLQYFASEEVEAMRCKTYETVLNSFNKFVRCVTSVKSMKLGKTKSYLNIMRNNKGYILGDISEYNVKTVISEASRVLPVATVAGAFAIIEA